LAAIWQGTVAACVGHNNASVASWIKIKQAGQKVKIFLKDTANFQQKSNIYANF